MTPPEPTPAALESSAALDQILPALLAAQGEIGPALKGARNPHFQSRYADLGAVLEAVRGPLASCQVLILNPVRPLDEGRTEIACVLLHSSGQWVRSRIVLPANTAKPQEVGSALTYYRRYLLAALLSVATEDDDGEAATRGKELGDRRSGVGEGRDLSSPPPRSHLPSPSRDSWAAWSARLRSTANDAWRAEMAIEGVPREVGERHYELVNAHQLVNVVCSHAIERGLIRAESVEKPGADGKPVRDRALAQKAVADLFARRPKGVQAFLAKYVQEKQAEARTALGLPHAGAEGGGDRRWEIGGRESGPPPPPPSSHLPTPPPPGRMGATNGAKREREPGEDG